MLRWRIAFIITLLCCIPVFLQRAAPGLFADTDTKVLLQTIRNEQAPFSWFVTDWPLKNHFYRPISTLAFEFDNAVYGDKASGYGLTNALLCIASVLLLFWFVREISDNPWMSVLSAGIFAFLHLDWGNPIAKYLWLLAPVILIVGFFRHGLGGRYYLPAVLLFVYLSVEFSNAQHLYFRMVAWLPGRTASVMTVFALIAMAAYARYERTSANTKPKKDPTPLDPPATKNTVLADKSKQAWWWALIACLSVALAMGSYEQAVMLPAALFGVSLTMFLQGYRVRWGWQAIFWGLLFGYLALRHAIIPSDVSGYQAQQFRNSPAVYSSIIDYIFPTLGSTLGLISTWNGGLVYLANVGPWLTFTRFASNVVAIYQARRQWVLILTGWALSVVTYLPMAWLKPFDHYHYWPLAMRSLLIAALIWVTWDLLRKALSPPSLQTPLRQTPAPGSLPS